MSAAPKLDVDRVASIRAASRAASQAPKPRVGHGFSVQGVLKKLTPGFLRKKEAFVRRHERYECCIVGEMEIVERFLALEGVILEVSQGGALFRPASTYLLDRVGEGVKLRLDGHAYAGTIMASRPVGYGIRLDQQIPAEVIEEIVIRYGLKPAAAPA